MIFPKCILQENVWDPGHVGTDCGHPRGTFSTVNFIKRTGQSIHENTISKIVSI